jgi:hypothetical protein
LSEFFVVTITTSEKTNTTTNTTCQRRSRPQSTSIPGRDRRGAVAATGSSGGTEKLSSVFSVRSSPASVGRSRSRRRRHVFRLTVAAITMPAPASHVMMFCHPSDASTSVIVGRAADAPARAISMRSARGRAGRAPARSCRGSRPRRARPTRTRARSRVPNSPRQPRRLRGPAHGRRAAADPA